MGINTRQQPQTAMRTRRRNVKKQDKKKSGSGTVEMDTESLHNEELEKMMRTKEEVIDKIQELEHEAKELDEEIETALKRDSEYWKNQAKTKATSTSTKESEPKGGHMTASQHFYEKRRYVLLFGIIIGLLIAAYNNIDKLPSDIRSQVDDVFNLDSLSLDNLSFDSMDWKGYLPDGLVETLNSRKKEAKNEIGAFSVGIQMKKKGLNADHNVIMVPGVTSTGLESWGLEGTDDCPSKPYFRKRLWGSFFMLRTMLMDKACWLKHVMLDPETGLDPPGITLRAAQGFEAADFFVTGYWIWNKVLENLAVIGYGPNNMYSAAYDWRLAYLDLERRDGYFSKLKSQIELSNELSGKKTVLTGHSMGSQVIFYFLKWVEASGKDYGNGGKGWVNKHIEAYVDISGSVLGTPKAIPALLSGEMKDTVELNGLAVYGLEKFFSRRERSDMLKSFGGLPSMLPKGGDLVWGDINSAPDDCMKMEDENDCVLDENDTYGNFIRFAQPNGELSQRNLTIAESIEYLLDQGPEWFKRRTVASYSYGYAKSKKELKSNEKDHTKWSNPLEVALPNAPDMKVYCFYGVGNPTERAYYYKEVDSEKLSSLNVTIDSEREGAVLMGEGDGTVSLMTHMMCHKWKEPGNAYNPGGSKVTVVEIEHKPDVFDIRGGAQTAEHVDILGSARLNELVLKVAAGHGDEIEDAYITRLREISEKVRPF